ncbi:transcriptional repressor LexA [Canibacter sp. lx-45]|uniref:transcriptional repressor LexA n=1 Tax=Canibacter zhuwentaonis TaxID=2837491 RepID=UPI001BDD129A|nr:transcriptional repressor LexA [Canibacter zhuwentaonis]MBT1035089.1 transcriptional repressor LexA [Canibacter zhuwentaonis]
MQNSSNSLKPLLKAKQQRVYDYLLSENTLRGYPPSMREIAEHCGFASISSVSHQLSRLESMGYIRRAPGKSRSIEIVDAPAAQTADAQNTSYGTAEAYDIDSSNVAVPLVGQIAAGVPITAQQHVEDTMALPKSLVGSGNIFMLKVVGDSMIDAAICDGDYVVVREQADAENGDIVAAMLDEEATVKTLKRRDGNLWLLPQNTQFEPILGNEATILGKVVAVFRAL